MISKEDFLNFLVQESECRQASFQVDHFLAQLDYNKDGNLRAIMVQKVSRDFDSFAVVCPISQKVLSFDKKVLTSSAPLPPLQNKNYTDFIASWEIPEINLLLLISEKEVVFLDTTIREKIRFLNCTILVSFEIIEVSLVWYDKTEEFVHVMFKDQREILTVIGFHKTHLTRLMTCQIEMESAPFVCYGQDKDQKIVPLIFSHKTNEDKPKAIFSNKKFKEISHWSEVDELWNSFSLKDLVFQNIFLNFSSRDSVLRKRYPMISNLREDLSWVHEIERALYSFLSFYEIFPNKSFLLTSFQRNLNRRSKKDNQNSKMLRSTSK
jgi:hypothetical protein